MRDELFKWLCQGSNPSIHSYIGETAFHNLANAETVEEGVVDTPLLADYTYLAE